MSTTLTRAFAAITLLIVFRLNLSASTHISICSSKGSYSYPIDKCPGGIQIRNAGGWFSDARNATCVCGQGSLLQFDGEGKPWHERVYSSSLPKWEQPFLGSWFDYNLKGCEGIRGMRPAALFIDVRKFENPSTFPSRTLELIVKASEHSRIVGSYSIELQKQKMLTPDSQPSESLKTVMLNSHKPFLLTANPEQSAARVCVHHPNKPEIVLGKYLTTFWGVDNLEESCKKGMYAQYSREKAECAQGASCGATSSEGGEVPAGSIESFLNILQEMAEVSVRMKYTGRHLEFSMVGDASNDKPYMAMLQRSCRVFYRGYPEVVRWETLMNALTIFGAVFEGLIPNEFDAIQADQVRIALGRCGLQQDKKRAYNKRTYSQTCMRGNISEWSSKSLRVRMDSVANPVEPSTAVEPSGAGSAESGQPSYNKLIELLWRMVQFTQAACLRGSDHYPNIHHIYAGAMIELFTTPAVQVLWYQKSENAQVLEKAMLHVFPELSDNVLPTIDTILQNMYYSTYFNVLQRPQLKHMEKRDMRCAGHGNLIWGGKACCYLEEEDYKFRFYNRVSAGKI